MPVQFLTPAEVLETPLGIALAPQLSALNAGVLDKLTFRASQKVNSFCRKRLQMPPTTTIASGGSVSAGATALSLASTLGFDNQAEQAILVGSGGTQELLTIVPGGVTVSSYVYPYPGTITLATPTAYGHSFGETVQGYWQEVSVTGHSSSADPFTEAFTQEAQLAQAHAPLLSRGEDLTRLVFTKHYPIVGIRNVEYTYSYDNAYYSLDVSSVAIHPTAGYYRLRVGTVVLPDAHIRTTYQAGYQVIPDDVKEATLLYLKDLLVDFTNPYGVIEASQGKRRQTFRSGSATKSPNAQEAENYLEGYRRKV